MLQLEVSIEAPWPEAPEWEELAVQALCAVIARSRELANPRLAVSLLLTDDAALRALNREWRGKDRPTNVLSFPMMERGELLALAGEGPPALLGDIAIALETCEREAAEREISLADHCTHLIIHGLLHLAGHDHETGAEDARAMENLETKALALLGIADPYGDH